MRKSTLALCGSLVLMAVPAVSQAGWSSRVSTQTAPAVSTRSLTQVAPIGENYKLPTRADRVQGMPPYAAFADSPYSAPASPPSVAAAPAQEDPVYFNTVMGSNRF